MKYYLHDTSAFEDEKVTELFMQFGFEGVGIFYVILEKLAKQEKPVKTSVLKAQLRIGKRLEKCWDFMEEIGLIYSNNGETFNKQLLNFSENYQIKKEKTRKRVAEWRKNQEDTENVTCYVPVSNTPKVKLSKDNKENNKESDDKIVFSNDSELVKVKQTWRDDFNIYLEECRVAFALAWDDELFMEQQQRFNPNLDIGETLFKSFNNYWGTEEGWKKKKASRAKVINWKSTILTSLSNPLNKVYKQKQ